MTKRTAMLMAAGLVLALLGGSVALSFGLSGGTTASADPSSEPERVVRTIHRTVRLERPAKDRPVEVVTVATGSTAPIATAAPDVADDHEGEAYDDHEGDDDHEAYDDDHEGEDREDPGDDDHQDGSYDDDHEELGDDD